MAVNFKKIQGVNYVRDLTDIADFSVSRKGDGYISIDSAKKIIKKVHDNKTYTQVEIKTLKYIRDKYKFKAEAGKYFKAEINKMKSAKKNNLKAGARFTSKTKKSSGVILKKKSSGSIKTVRKTAARSKSQVKPKSVDKKDVKAFEEAASIQDFSSFQVNKEKKSFLKYGIFGIIIVIIVLLLYFLMPDTKKISSENDTVKEKSPEADTKIADIEKQTPEKPASTEEAKYREYKIKLKDQLTEISKQFYGNHADWKKIYEANKDTIQNPNLIFPGHTIKIPDLEK